MNKLTSLFKKLVRKDLSEVKVTGDSVRLFLALFPHTVTKGKLFVFGNDFLILLMHHNIHSAVLLLICLVLHH